MASSEPLQDLHESDESESEDEVEEIPIPEVEVDVTKLTPLSPEVISKQVRAFSGCRKGVFDGRQGDNQSRFGLGTLHT